MSSPMIAFAVGVFVGVLIGIFLVGILNMANEEKRISSSGN